MCSTTKDLMLAPCLSVLLYHGVLGTASCVETALLDFENTLVLTVCWSSTALQIPFTQRMWCLWTSTSDNARVCRATKQCFEV